MWPFGRKDQREPTKTTSLCSDDSSITRARKMLDHANVRMDAMAAMEVIMHMSEVIEAYRRLDADAAKVGGGDHA